MLSATFDDRGGGANYPAFSADLTSSRAIFRDPEILYIIRRTCCTSQGDPDSSFPCGQCFKRHKEEKSKQARKMANMTNSVMHKSCNKIMIGKVYWKSVVLPSVLMGASVICWTKLELEVLQRIEYGVWQTMLGVPGYALVSTVHCEVGASGVVARDIEQKLSYQKYRIVIMTYCMRFMRMLCGTKLEIGIELLESTVGG